MALLLRRRESTEETTVPERRWPGLRRGPRTVAVERPAEPGPVTRSVRAWRRARPVSTAIWSAAWAATLVLLLGMLLVATHANQANGIVHAIMRTGTWLATPFDDIFRNTDHRRQLYENWGVAAAAYFLVGRALALMIRW